MGDIAKEVSSAKFCTKNINFSYYEGVAVWLLVVHAYEVLLAEAYRKYLVFWEEHWCEEHGRFYYWNSMTDESTWDRPRYLDSWAEHRCEKYGRFYYWNSMIDEFSWDQPRRVSSRE